MNGPPPESEVGYDLYWGDFHKHMTGPGADPKRLDDVLSAARSHLDVQTVLCYPFKWDRKGREAGIREESVGHDTAFEDWWERIQDAAREHYDPGAFVTFPGFEWHGNRTRWGDYNVLYREEGYPLEPVRELPDLYEAIRGRPALAIPHHTGYEPGNRGADWAVHDPDLSPVVEVYSSHGSSEGIETPVAMDGNEDMGPRTSGGTWQDALARGHRIGALASNDGPGFPGSWGNGIAGVWATDLTREAVWDAIQARRTYGVTGDRIRLWWEIDGAEMGSVVSTTDPTGRVLVSCPRPLARVELVHDGRTVETYAHHPGGGRDKDDVYAILVEFGWGPNEDYGDFDDVTCKWRGTLCVEGGNLRGVTPQFRGFGQWYEVVDDECRFRLTTSREGPSETLLPEGNQPTSRQGLILTCTGDGDALVRIDLKDRDPVRVQLSDARERAHLFAFTDESRSRLEEDFGLRPDDLENPDVVYHNARKVKVHAASPRSDRTAEVVFRDLPTAGTWNYYYVRAAQVNGQYAWSSPVWVVSN